MTIAGTPITDTGGAAAGTTTRRAATTTGGVIPIPGAIIVTAVRGTLRTTGDTGIAGTAIDGRGAPVFRTGRAVPLAAPPSRR